MKLSGLECVPSSFSQMSGQLEMVGQWTLCERKDGFASASLEMEVTHVEDLGIHVSGVSLGGNNTTSWTADGNHISAWNTAIDADQPNLCLDLTNGTQECIQLGENPERRLHHAPLQAEAEFALIEKLVKK